MSRNSMEPDRLDPIFSSEWVMKNADHVSLNLLQIEKLADEVGQALKSGAFSNQNWRDQDLTPKIADERAVEWIFITDLLNFSFWTDENNKYVVNYKNKNYTGYWSMCAAINRAIDEGIDILDPNVYHNISKQQLEHIFRSYSNENIPLLNERLELLHDAGNTLLKYFHGKFTEVLNRSNNSAISLLKSLCEHFPSFRDFATFKGQKISFLKRAQILVGDLWSCFDGKGYGHFYDIDKITVFADYRVPQVLAYFGAIQYDTKLNDVLQKGILIENGDELEIEIRASTILAAHHIEKLLKSQNIKCNSILIDNYLWEYRRAHAEQIEKQIPMHKTRSIYY